jgi:hypothetical protein
MQGPRFRVRGVRFTVYDLGCVHLGSGVWGFRFIVRDEGQEHTF